MVQVTRLIEPEMLIEIEADAIVRGGNVPGSEGSK
jgi:hypothetical protein